jgi:hypothetical protein
VRLRLEPVQQLRDEAARRRLQPATRKAVNHNLMLGRGDLRGRQVSRRSGCHGSSSQ